MKSYLPLSYSSLKQFAISPAHFIAYKAREHKPTASMLLGTALHTLVLEPKEFNNRYLVIPDGTRRGTKAFKEFEALAAVRGEECEIIKESEYKPILRMRDNILDHPEASKLLAACDTFEQRSTWEFNGILFHGFKDGEGPSIILDLKTTQDASVRKFSRQLVDLRYYWQAALYSCESNYKKDFYIIAVENKSPYNVAVYKLSQEFIDLAVRELIEVTNRFKKWDGMSKSYSNEIQVLTPPSYLL
jgi:exodeoxyribonuclease VIII